MIIEGIVFVLAIISDLLTKAQAEKVLSTVSRVDVFPGFFSFIYTKNTGAAFGSFAGSKFILIVLPIIMILGMIGYLVYNNIKLKKINLFKTSIIRVSFILILSGAVANLYDRIKFSYVRDFISYDILENILKKPFAIGNVADLYVMFGAIFIIFALCLNIIKTINEERCEEMFKIK